MVMLSSLLIFFKPLQSLQLLGGILHSNGHGDGRANHGVVAHRRLRLRESADQSPQTLDITVFEQLAC